MVLEGQVAIVTGGGQGIGKAVALRFAAEGADVGIIDVNGTTAESTGEEIRGLGRRAIATTTDVVQRNPASSGPVGVTVGVRKRQSWQQSRHYDRKPEAGTMAAGVRI